MVRYTHAVWFGTAWWVGTKVTPLCKTTINNMHCYRICLTIYKRPQPFSHFSGSVIFADAFTVESIIQTPRYCDEKTTPRVLARPVSSLSLGVVSDSSGTYILESCISPGSGSPLSSRLDPDPQKTNGILGTLPFLDCSYFSENL